MSQIKDVNTTKTELEKQAVDCYNEAEKPGGDIQLLLAKGNAMWKTAGEKQKLIDELNAAAQKLLQEHKDLCK